MAMIPLPEAVEAFFDKALEKLGDLAELARAIGGYYFLLVVGAYLLYRSFNQNLPIILAAWERNQKSKRSHERRMTELRAAQEERARMKPGKRKKEAGDAA